MSLADDLKKVVRGEVETSREALEVASKDASLFKIVPEAVVHPLDAEDIEKLVQFASDRKQKGEKIALTARSAGTDMSGGPLTDSLVVSMTKHLNHLFELENRFAVVEPGMYYRDFDKKTKEKNLELPSYTASREINTVGGMVANNSGGEKNLKYGKTARYVEELEVVLSDGKKHTLRKYEGDALKAKLAEQSFEGDLHRKMAELVRRNRDVIERGKPKVEKNSSGYALWDIGDGEHSLNLARLMVGAQGTLGLITKIRFSLVQPKTSSAMVVVFVDKLAQLGAIVPSVLRHQPDSFESYDDQTFHLAVKYFPEFAAQMKAGLFKLGIEFLPEVWMTLTGGVPKLVLLIEFRGSTQEEAVQKAEKLALEFDCGSDKCSYRVLRSAQEAHKYWVIRRESFNLLRKKVRGKRTAPFIDDFVVPPDKLPEFLPKLETIMQQYKNLTYTVAGHVGDGNFHIIPLIDPTDPTIVRTMDDAAKKVYDLVLQYDGSISGEHNDGLIRTPYVEQMFGADMYNVFKEVKKIFDPLGIFNPGKKVGGTFAEARRHLDLSLPK